MQTIKLQGIGETTAITAGELKVGDITIWNYGEKETITSIEETKSGKSVIVGIKAGNGYTSTRRMLKSRLVGIQRRDIEEIKVEDLQTGDKIHDLYNLDLDTFATVESVKISEDGKMCHFITDGKHSNASFTGHMITIAKREKETDAPLPEIEESEEEPKQETTLAEGDKVKVHIYGTDGKEISTRNKDIIFEVKKENGHLGIDYNTERSPYTCHGDIFQQFYTFANNCIFERITDGKKFYYSDIYKCLIEKEEPQPTPPEPTKAEKSAEVEPVTEEQTEPTAKPAAAEIVPTYYPISEQTARTAQEINSFYKYKSGSATATYKSEVDEVYRIVELIAEKRPEQAEKALNMANRYSKKLADYYNAYYRNEASCPSILICGGGNFPTAKKNKQNSRRNSLMKEWQYLQDYKKKINNILTCQNVIKSGDDDAVEQLKSKIEKLEQAQNLYKSANKAIRLKDTDKGNAELEKLGFTKPEIDELRKPDFCGRVGYPSYVLQNNLANIKRLKDRLAGLEKAKVTETTEETATDTDGNELFQIVRNTEIMRLQLFFYGKPDIETRNMLKSNGFKWAPSKKAWQRVLNSNAEYALERLKKEFSA